MKATNLINNKYIILINLYIIIVDNHELPCSKYNHIRIKFSMHLIRYYNLTTRHIPHNVEKQIKVSCYYKIYPTIGYYVKQISFPRTDDCDCLYHN